jgi:hypothetical protein
VRAWYWLSGYVTGVAAMVAIALALAWLSGCMRIEADDYKPNLTPIGAQAEAYCQLNPELPCGTVYAFRDQPRANPLGFLEMCFLDSDPESLNTAEAMWGEAAESWHPRFDGYPICLHCCGEGCGKGANAYDGTWCP